MGHDLREPACTFDMVPDVTLDCLASTSKMCDAGYLTVFDGEEVRIYDAETTKVVTSKPPVLKGWCDVVSTLWRIPLTKRAPGPDSGHLTNRAPGTRPTSWDPKNCHSPLAPSPQGNNRQRLPAEDKAGGHTLLACSGGISNRGNMVLCGEGW